ncbi:TIGR03564 family F420-dependent LLM class oxidoreductase [Nocardia asteroides]|uniref:TIGR03564 family F420-dependent LLM class oxidoreductase n=1 Tax=Nocardia asteroides TaxID=1824 RepID=UPI001E3AE225|nr:TIGR03564 family F420-dependent LLM class oxidoreductase [Nocardia asteroides]UGT62009.1 TIGR03564 family F420-dependent LLM class oxidoreductase [Nocardia asteroides]
MRIGLTGGAASTGRLVEQACRAEDEGFTSLWYASAVLGDPLTAMAIAGLATSRIELGTAVVQTYPCHPVLQARRAAAAAEAMARPGFTLGIGPSHRSLVTDVYGLDYDHPGRNTEEYLRILTAVLRTGSADVDGVDWRAHTGEPTATPEHPVPVLLSAMSPRLLRVAGELADGIVSWMAPAQVLETRITPALTAAAAAAGRPSPRIVAGLPVAVHDDVAEARASVAANATAYADQPNYRRILAAGGLASPAEAAVVGDEKSVESQLRALLDAGATDIWAAVFPVGPDRVASVRRTRELLRSLVG